ncbi:MAG: prolipoprotein diacylglyceryl transferase family protein [Patescibacteria group bacterium]
MVPVLFSLGPITVSTFGFFAALSFIVASFFLWRKLRDDYPEEEILNFTIILTLGAILGGRIIYLLTAPEIFFQPLKWLAVRSYPGFSLLGALASGVLILYFWQKKKSWNFWLVADTLVTALFWVLVLLGAGLVLSIGEKFSSIFALLSSFCLVLSFIFVKNYRKFIWYKSGKPGFSACLALAIFFGGFFLLEIILNRGIYWERVGVLILAFVCLGFLYRRSERSPREDIRSFVRLCLSLRRKK